MLKFDTKVQYLKYRVLREVARLAWEDKLLENVVKIPKMIVPGKEPTMRCCVYKERPSLPSASTSPWVAIRAIPMRLKSSTSPVTSARLQDTK